jgi:GTP-binding protein
MSAKTATFLLSAPSFSDCPPESLPEVCFAGRSNVGKSSMINAIVGRKKLVKTSNMPGKTRAFNYFTIDEAWFLVDLPGYGFAKVSKTERDRWTNESRNYFKQRGTLRLIVSIVDARHEPSDLDEKMIFWLAENQLPFIVALSKADKLSGNKKTGSLARVKRLLKNMNIEVPVVLTSAETGEGIEEIRTLVQDFINDNYYTS